MIEKFNGLTYGRDFRYCILNITVCQVSKGRSCAVFDLPAEVISADCKLEISDEAEMCIGDLLEDGVCGETIGCSAEIAGQNRFDDGSPGDGLT